MHLADALGLAPLPPLPQLLVEVVQQLQRMFTPDVKVIKRAIDSLIDVRAPAPWHGAAGLRGLPLGWLGLGGWGLAGATAAGGVPGRRLPGGT